MIKRIKKHLPLIFLATISLFAIAFFDTDHLLQQKNNFIELTKQNKALSIIIYSLTYIVIVALSIPIATFLTVFSGVVFGTVLGTIATVISASIGACFIFLTVKHSFGDTLLKKDIPIKTLKKIQDNIKTNEVYYLLFARIVPIFPFALVNIAPATIGVKSWTYFWTTFIGIIPGTAIYTYLGHNAGQITNIDDLFSPQILITLALLGGLSLIPVFIKKHKG